MLKSNDSVIASGNISRATLLLILSVTALVSLQRKQLMGNFNDLDLFLCDTNVAGVMNVTPLLDLPNEEEARRDTFSPIDSPAKKYLKTIETTTPPINSAGSLLAVPTHTPPHLVKLPQVSPLSYLQSSTPSPNSGLPTSQDAGLIFKEPKEESGAPQATVDFSLQEKINNKIGISEHAQVGSEFLQAAHSAVEEHRRGIEGVAVTTYPPSYILQSARQADDVFPIDQQITSIQETNENSLTQSTPVYPSQVAGIVRNATFANTEYQNTRETVHNGEPFLPQIIPSRDQNPGLQLSPTGTNNGNFMLQLPLDKSLDRRKRWVIATSQCLRLLSESALEQVTLSVMREMPPNVILQLRAWATTLDHQNSFMNEPFRKEQDKPSNGTNGSTIAQPILQAGQPSQSEQEVTHNTYDAKPQEFGEESNLETGSNIPEILHRENKVHLIDQKSLRALISPLEGVEATLTDEIGHDIRSVVHEQLEEHPGLKTENLHDIGYSGESSSQDILHAPAHNGMPVAHPVAHVTLCGQKENWHTRMLQLQSACVTEVEKPEPQSVLQMPQWTQTETGTLVGTSNRVALTEKRSRELFEEDCVLPGAKRFQFSSGGRTKPKRALSEAAKLIARKHQDLRLRNQRERSVQSEHSLAIPLPLAPCATPSRFCHLCTRTAKQDEVLVCKNVARGACRKVICFRCAEDHRWDVETLRKDRGWTCTHCRNECPGKAQCHTYKRVNQYRRADGRRTKSRPNNN